MVGMLQREEVDIQLGALTILAAREQVDDGFDDLDEEASMDGDNDKGSGEDANGEVDIQLGALTILAAREQVEDGGVANKMMVNVMRNQMWMVMLKKMLRIMMRKPKFWKR